jgi:prepilin-type N-terminal cleavage/methylation domain-containing protein
MKWRCSVKGFTLVETLVAVAILTLAFLAPFQAIQSVTSQTRIAKDQLIASSLAQEGLEYVRFIRDNNYLGSPATFSSGNLQLHGLDGNGGPNCTGANKCTIDPTVTPASAVASCASTCLPLYTSSEGYYTQVSSGNTQSLFTRSVQVAQHAGYETATVTVFWNDHGTHSIVLTENFYDWF